MALKNDATVPEIEILLKYVYGDMENELEKKNLETQISNDILIAEAVEGIKKLREEFQFKSYLEHQKWLEEKQEKTLFKFERLLEQPLPHKIKPKRRWLLLVATAAVIALLIGFFSYPWAPSASNIEMLIAENSNVPFFASKEKSITNSDQPDIHDRLDSYFKEKQYDKALTDIQVLFAEDSIKYQNLRFHEGFFHLEKGELDQSIEAFEWVATHPDHIYREQAHVEIGLAYLRFDQIEKAIHTFEAIAADSPYPNRKKEAEKILEQIQLQN